MKYLKYFPLVSEYDTYINGEPIFPNVSFVDENGQVYFNTGGGKLDPALLEIAGTAIVFDTQASQLITVAGEDYNVTDYPQDKYIPVGVVIMPASHSEDGNARMMSCKLMGVKTDANGTVTYGSYDASNIAEFDNYGGIAWASPTYSVATGATTALINYYSNTATPFPVVTSQPAAYVDGSGVINPYQVNTENTGLFYYTNMPLSDAVAGMLGVSWIADGETGNGWNAMSGGESQVMPSPYLADGKPNTAMRVSGTSMGIVHGSYTSNMVNRYVDATNENNRFDIFAATRAYSTSGTKSGDWYVPSTLELAYFSAKMKEIYSTMNKLNPNFDESFDSLLAAQGFDESYLEPGTDINYLASWASALYSSSRAWYGALPISSDSGTVTNYFDYFGFAVAPVRN